MKSKLHFPKHFWMGLVFILLTYTFIQLMYSPFFPTTIFGPIKTRQLFRWSTIGIVYVVGSVVLRWTAVRWLIQIWHLIHLSLITYLVLVAGWEYLISPVPYGIRSSVSPIIEFLISPILYLGSGLLYAFLQDSSRDA